MNIQLLKTQRNQDGVVLLYGLLIMMVLAVISLTAAQTVVTNEKITGNHQDYALAMHRAEDGLVEAENTIEALDALPIPETFDGLVWELGEAGGASTIDSESSEWIKQLDKPWWEARAEERNEDIYYFIEYVTQRRDNLTVNNDYSNHQAGNYFYRVTSRSEGETGASVIVQSIYAKRFE